MSATRKLMNDWLFAPDRYLNKSGEKLHGNRISQVLSRPDAKATMLASIVAAFGFAAASDDSAAQESIILGTSLLIAMTIPRPKIGKTYYFDTQPTQEIPLPDNDIKRELAFHASPYYLAFKTGAEITYGTVAGGIVYAVTKDASMAGTAGFILSSAYVTEGYSKYWRANEVLDGNWNVTTIKPEKEEKAKSSRALQQPSYFISAP